MQIQRKKQSIGLQIKKQQRSAYFNRVRRLLMQQAIVDKKQRWFEMNEQVILTLINDGINSNFKCIYLYLQANEQSLSMQFMNEFAHKVTKDFRRDIGAQLCLSIMIDKIDSTKLPFGRILQQLLLWNVQNEGHMAEIIKIIQICLVRTNDWKQFQWLPLHYEKILTLMCNSQQMIFLIQEASKYEELQPNTNVVKIILDISIEQVTDIIFFKICSLLYHLSLFNSLHYMEPAIRWVERNLQVQDLPQQILKSILSAFYTFLIKWECNEKVGSHVISCDLVNNILIECKKSLEQSAFVGSLTLQSLINSFRGFKSFQLLIAWRMPFNCSYKILTDFIYQNLQRIYLTQIINMQNNSQAMGYLSIYIYALKAPARKSAKLVVQQQTNTTQIIIDNLQSYFQMMFKIKSAFLTFVFLIFTAIFCKQIKLTSRLNTDQIYTSNNVKNSELYNIDVNRVESSKELEESRCKAGNKYIDISSKTQIFRLSKSQTVNRQEKVYQKLTSLNEQENIIEQFQIIGSNIFAITTQGDGYFISLQDYSKVHKIKTNFFQQNSGQLIDVISIKNYKDNALIVGRNRIALCKIEREDCEIVQGYEEMKNFRGAQLYEQNGKYFIYIIRSDSLIVYQLTANGKLKNQQILDSNFFGVQRISLRALYRTESKKILVVDDLQGIRQINIENGLDNFKNGTKLIYEQYGCYQIVGQDKGESLALACAPSLNTYFILKLVKSRQFAQPIYEPLQTVFLHQKLYQIDCIENLLLSRVFSGVKLFWSSKKLGNPYPHFYRNAGDLFLHNAIQAKLKQFNKTKSIFLAAEDELLIYQLETVQPYITCSSSEEVTEQYKLTYYFPCNQQAFMHQENICTSEEVLVFQSWEHKELKIMAHVIPFLVLLAGVVAIAYTLIRIYKKYGTDVELARLKYNIADNQMDS